MKKILVPTDFSEQANNALEVASQLARKYNSEIYLLHLLELPSQLIDPTTNSGNQIPETIYFMKMAHKKFEEIKNKDFLKDIPVYETVIFQDTLEGIREVGEKNNCDLIVMGSHGADGFKEVFIGSNTEKVVRNSDIPVLVIKDHLPNFKVSNFVFASDFVPKVKKSFLEAVKFAEKVGAKMHLVYINTANKFKTTEYLDKQMSTFLEDVDFKNYTLNVYNAESIEQGVLKFAANKEADLVGISTHGRKGLAHFLNGSVSEDLVNHAKRPVITFKAQ
ncbi:Nucleotide-binding universal stress protein, UspA family [Mesonia phycicola]|uniref:Nucleotide-binding universal stress protein, UspA family n=1 Tax=Mesonia phycicola TaxID=579105 RepID=A0A1M6ETQ6_9FLAO|nr:universal stress protein [Mesonia phycicola]SHI88832.1 Nucleotide-binding universal stress protein, UspA family [Mesonia phycicola]